MHIYRYTYTHSFHTHTSKGKTHKNHLNIHTRQIQKHIYAKMDQQTHTYKERQRRLQRHTYMHIKYKGTYTQTFIHLKT